MVKGRKMKDKSEKKYFMKVVEVFGFGGLGFECVISRGKLGPIVRTGSTYYETDYNAYNKAYKDYNAYNKAYNEGYTILKKMNSKNNS
jgi:hypothetical protein